MGARARLACPLTGKGELVAPSPDSWQILAAREFTGFGLRMPAA